MGSGRVRMTFAATFFLVFLCVAHAWAQAPLRVVWATDDTPGGEFIVGGGTTFNEAKPGIEIELYRLVGKKLNLDIQFKRIPWKLCLEQIGHDKVDGIFATSFKPERLKIGVYPMANGQPDPTRKTRDIGYYLYRLKSSNLAWDGTAFGNVSGVIAAPSGWAVVEDLKKMGVEVKEVPVHAESPDLLLQKRVQGFICLETVFDGYLKRNPEKYAQIEKVSPPITEKHYFLMLSHKFVQEHPELAEKVWDTIRDIKKSKEYDVIVDKYLE